MAVQFNDHDRFLAPCTHCNKQISQFAQLAQSEVCMCTDTDRENDPFGNYHRARRVFLEKIQTRVEARKR